MSRWGKNIVVPLDSLCKEKEYTNRPTVARSVGTVGKWGKMGFTSTRTYSLSGLPAAVAAAAAAAASPSHSPASAILDDDMSPSVPDPPKPKKFFKSRNAAPPEVIAQIIQHLPRAPTSPIGAGGDHGHSAAYHTTHVATHSGREPIKLKLPKSNSIEKKKKSPKKLPKAGRGRGTENAVVNNNSNVNNDASMTPSAELQQQVPPTEKFLAEPKPKKRKEEKKLKPEAPPSRIISRARKTVNYCEDDDDERQPYAHHKESIVKPQVNPAPPASTPSERVLSPALPAANAVVPPMSASNVANVSAISDPICIGSGGNVSAVDAIPAATSGVQSVPAKVIEHPPIVLRISKGTSRLVSTDSEEQQQLNTISPPQHQERYDAIEETQDEEAVLQQQQQQQEEEFAGDCEDEEQEETEALPPLQSKIIVKPPKPPPVSQQPSLPSSTNNSNSTPVLLNEHNEINYCTVKISPDKPPKERLKLIIKTDVIRNAMAAAAAMAANAAAEKMTTLNDMLADGSETQHRPEREKKSKSKKHKHPKHAVVEQLMPAQQASVIGSEFKTPSPHLVLGGALGAADHQTLSARTIISPPALSERDFDSQSSVLGSISSKGNSTPSQPLAQTVQEESCVIHSRGSSVITSDLETSQHSSLVAPPSDIESRLESMMMDGEVSQRAIHLAEEEPLQEDILAVLRGDESQAAASSATAAAGNVSQDVRMNGTVMTMKAEEHVTKESEMDTTACKPPIQAEEEQEGGMEETNKRRFTRGRGRNAAATTPTTSNANVDVAEQPTTADTAGTTKPAARPTRGRRNVAATTISPVSESCSAAIEETSPPANSRRTTRRAGKKAINGREEAGDATLSTAVSVEPAQVPLHGLNSSIASPLHNKSSEEENNMNTPAQKAAASTGRRRNTRNATNINHNNLNNNNINKIAANLSAKAGAAEEAKSLTTTPKIERTASTPSAAAATAIMAQRSYGRKRKNQQVMQVLQPSAEELEEQHHQQHQATPAKISNLDQSMESSGSAAIASDALAPAGVSAHSRPNSDEAAVEAASPPRRHDYKVKDKFKRTLTLDSQVNCNPIVAAAAAAAASATAAASSSTANDNGDDGIGEQRGAVKLVISKKKGSIFKSRALGGPADQSEQSTAAAKRRLYKHRWDAEANGVADQNDEVNDALREAKELTNAATTRTTSGSTDNVFDAEFSEEINVAPPSGSVGVAVSSTRDSSPASFSKFTRQIKSNSQVAPSGGAYDMDALAAGEAMGFGSGKSDRKAKDYYTVVRNVKTAHQIQEIGEHQEMDDDVEYILDALQPHNPTATRCLSALQLATKCMTPAFRMHVRAHGVVTKFFKALSDANSDLSLGLCTSAIMYILSQEGLNMDLDRDSLELMMNLLESEGVAAPSDRVTYERNKQKVRELCEEIKAQGKATHLNVESITVGTLAMETLLSLTSKRAGEWFKEELRELGGLEHIIKTISDCCRPVFDGGNGSTKTETTSRVDWTQPLLENMQTVARCMRVLENVTQINEENQKYMLTFSGGAAVNTLCTLYRLCDREIMLHPVTATDSASPNNPGVVLRELLIPLMKVLINLTHAFNPANAIGAELLGQRADIFDISFHLLLQAHNYIPDRCIFELSMLVSLLLINLSMHTVENRTRIIRSNAPVEFAATNRIGELTPQKSAVQALMEYFYRCEEMARLVEKNTDAILDNTNKNNKKKQEEVEETVNNLIQKAGHHMEHTLKGSYVAILIGYLITNSEENEAIVRRYVRGNGFKEIVTVLEKYHTFMNLTASSEAAVVAHIKSTKSIIDCFKKRDLIYEMNDGDDDNAIPLNLETHPHSHDADNAACFGTGIGAITSAAATSSCNSITHNNFLATDCDGASSSNVSPSTKTTMPSAATATSATSSPSIIVSASTLRNNNSNMQRVYKTYSQR